MRVLFIVSVASFCTVLWLALALARRVRRDREGRQRPTSPAQAVEFFEAGEFRTPRSLRLNQNVTQQSVRRNPEAPHILPHRAHLVPMRHEPAIPPQRSASPASPAKSDHRQEMQVDAQLPQGSPAVIINSKLQFVPMGGPRPKDTAPHHTLSADIPGERKSPQPARSGSFRRVDLSHYNKDMGDLTDPYTQSSRTAGIAPRTKNA